MSRSPVLRDAFLDSPPSFGPVVGAVGGPHFEFTPINIEPIILRNKIKDLREVPALVSIFRLHASLSTASSFVVAIPE